MQHCSLQRATTHLVGQVKAEGRGGSLLARGHSGSIARQSVHAYGLIAAHMQRMLDWSCAIMPWICRGGHVTAEAVWRLQVLRVLLHVASRIQLNE